MDLTTKQYRVSIPGKQCRKCVHYKRPMCLLMNLPVWAKNHCDDYERKESQENTETGSSESS